MKMWIKPTNKAIIKIFCGNTKAFTDGIINGLFTGIKSPKAPIPKRLPIKPLVISPKINVQAPHATKIKPKLFIILLFFPNPRIIITPIIRSTNPYPASVRQNPKKKGNTIAIRIVGSNSL